MSNYKVAFINPLPDYIPRFLETVPEGFELEVVRKEAPVEEKCRAVEDADFLISGVETPEEVFRAGKKLKFIQYMSSGFGQLPPEVLDDLSVPVAQMKAHSISVAEHAVTLAMMALRRIPYAQAAMKEGKWRENLDELSFSELYHKTVGIVGLGNIGRWIAKICSKGFDADVVYYDRLDMPLTVEELIPAKAVSLDELFKVSDVVFVCLPFNEESDKLIGKEHFALMGPRGVVVNISRGEVIRQDELIEALETGQIAAAGLDVYDREPLSMDSKLRTMEQVILTPHMAGVGWENVERRVVVVWDNLQRVLRGEEPRGVVTRIRKAPR
ncbi:MAG: hypothetical protein IJH75_03965 [Mogibacterium sp.]|nr:hypothetical protein [Mogibacterium sp.]